MEYWGLGHETSGSPSEEIARAKGSESGKL